MTSPKGLGLYVRRIGKKHGTPAQFARRCVRGGLTWIALGGLWQDVHNGKPTSKWITAAGGASKAIAKIHKYGDALEAAGIKVWVWGYPWQDREEAFVRGMLEAAKWGRVLLDPELGANPKRASKGAGKRKADRHATLLIELFAELETEYHQGRLKSLLLSTFGSGLRLKWFPLLAFTRALVRYFGGRTGIGGQTYTDDGFIDTSMAEFIRAIERSGGVLIQPASHVLVSTAANGVELVPNFGTYTWEHPVTGKRGKRMKGAKAKAKTRAELREHLYEFINEDEPIDCIIGWAENFMNAGLWEELKSFSKLMYRGACRL